MTIKRIAQESKVAKKYALAYMNVFGDLMTEQDYEAVKRAARSLKKNKRLIFFWRLTVIDPVIKALSVEQIGKKYLLSPSIKKLCYLLIERSQLFLIPELFAIIEALYCQRHSIENFVITSACDLAEDEKSTIVHYLATSTQKNIAYSCAVNKNLIAGFRMQSNFFLWEYSIRKNLHLLQLSLIK